MGNGRWLICFLLWAVMLAAEWHVCAQPNQGMQTQMGSWMQVADNPTIALPVFTAECWVRFRSGGLVVTRDHSGGTPSDWQLWYEGSAQRLAFITAQSPPDSYFYTPVNSVLPNVWHHIALVVNGPAGWARLYVDGVLIISPSFSSRNFNANTGLAWGGYFNNGSGAYLRADFDECRYWSVTRTLSEILNTKDRLLRKDERNDLMGYWMFCGNFADSSGHGNDGVAMGSASIIDILDLPFGVRCTIVSTSIAAWLNPFRISCERERPAEQLMWIHNSGLDTLLVTSALITGSGASAFSLKQPSSIPPSFAVPPRDSAAITVVYDPPAPGNHAASLHLLCNASATPDYVVPLEGNMSLASLSGQDVDVGILTSGVLPKDTTIILVNDGNGDVVLEAVQHSDPPLKILTQLPATIRQGDTLRIRVRLHPLVEDSMTLLLRFIFKPSCDPLEIRIKARLKNTGGLRSIDTLRIRLVHCELAPGVVFDTTVMLRNTATRTVRIHELLASPDSVLSVLPPVQLPAVLLPGEVLTLPLRIRLRGFGMQQLMLTVRSDAPEQSERVIVIELELIRQGGLLVTSVDFGALDTASFPAFREMHITNLGRDTVTISAATFRIGRPFRIVSGLPVLLAPNASIVLRIAFDRPSSDSLFIDSLRLIAIPLCGTAVARITGSMILPLVIEYPAVVSVDLRPCDFGPKDTTIRIRNTGQKDLIILDVSIVPVREFSISVRVVFPVRIPPGTAWDLPLRFTPGQAGQFHAVLNLTTNDSRNSHIEIKLEGSAHGTGVVHVTALQFGSIDASEFPAHATVNISNLGLDTVRIDSITFRNTRWITVESPLPLLIAPGTNALMRFRFDRPTDPVGILDSITYHYHPACGPLKGIVQATYRPSSTISHPDSISIRIPCPGIFKDTCIEILNTGSAAVILRRAFVLGDTAFRLASTLPLNVPAFGRSKICLRFAANADGNYRATVLLYADDTSEAIASIDVSASVQSAFITASRVEFDTVRPPAIPGTAILRITNSGSLTAIVRAVHFSPTAPFRLVTVLPVSITPGAYADLLLEFTDPGKNGLFIDSAVVEYDPSCAPLYVPVEGVFLRDVWPRYSDSLRFRTMRCDEYTRDTTLWLHADAEDCVIDSIYIAGNNSFGIIAMPSLPVRIAAGDSLGVGIRFSAVSAGRYTAILRLIISSPTDTVFSFHMSGGRDSVALFAVSMRFGTHGSAAFPVTLPIPVKNTGEVEVVVMRCSVLGSGAFSVLTPFPLTIPTGETREVFVQCVRPVGTAPVTDTILLFNGSLCDPLKIPVEIRRAPERQLNAADLDMPLLVCDSLHDTTIAIVNRGEIDLSIVSVGLVGDPVFSVIPPFQPTALAPGDSLPIGIRYLNQGTGFSHCTLLIYCTEIADTLRVSLSASRQTQSLRTSAVEFGRFRDPDFPVVLSTYVSNTGSVPLMIAYAVADPGSPFQIETAFPFVVAAGDSALIRIRFDFPSSTELETASFILQTEPPLCSPTFLKAHGSRRGSLRLIAPVMSAAPGDTIAIPLRIEGFTPATLASIRHIRTRLRFNASLLMPLETASSFLDAGSRIVDIDASPPAALDSNFYTLRCIATLGNDTATTLSLEEGTLIGSDADLIEIPGHLTIEDLCREGGLRLFDATTTAQLRQNAPNPFNPVTRIQFTTIESGSTRLLVYDVLGKEVGQLFDADVIPGTYSVSWDASALPSGVYIYTLITPTLHFSRTMQLRK